MLVVSELSVQKVCEEKQVMLQGEDFLTATLPFGWKHHLGLALEAFLDANQPAGRFHLEASIYELFKRRFLIFFHFVEQLHQQWILLLELFVPLRFYQLFMRYICFHCVSF